MDSLPTLLDSQWVLLTAAIIISLLLLKLLFRLIAGGLGPILMILGITVILQVFFDISPQELWFEISHLPQTVMHSLQALA